VLGEMRKARMPRECALGVSRILGHGVVLLTMGC
jgi:hypothetical protein